MTQEQKQRNLKLAVALESDKYKQIQGVLRNNEGYCCLGVACDLAKKALGLTWADINKQIRDMEEDVAPAVVAEYYGWNSCNPAIVVNSVTDSAASQNDSNEATFFQIAQGFRALAS